VTHYSQGAFEDIIATLDARMPEAPEPIENRWGRSSLRGEGINARTNEVRAGHRFFVPLQVTAAMNGLMRAILRDYDLRRPSVYSGW